MRSNFRTSLAAAITAAGLLSAAACGGGGGGGGRPSTSEISKALTKGGSDSALGGLGGSDNKAAADCIAKKLHDSKISDSGLRALVRQDKNYKPSSGDAKAAASVAGDIASCVGAGAN